MADQPSREGHRRGRLEALWIAVCGYCTDPGGYDDEPWQLEKAVTRAQALATMREYGWRYTARYGWVCNECWDAITAARRARGGKGDGL